MKTLLNGCAAVALIVGLAGQAHAEIVVREAPVHSAPADTDAAPPAMVMAPPAPVAAPADEDEDQPARPKVEQVAKAPAPKPEAAKLEVVKVESPAQARAEPSVVKALTEKAPTPQALTPDETAFFTILGKRVTDAASAYETYVRRASAIDAHFGDAAAVQKAVRSGAAYQPQQLQEGIVAYAALLALRNEAFVEGVKSLRDPAFADRLTGSPQMILAVRGSGEAAADVAGALRAQGAALLAAGKTITQAAYDVQAEGWSKTPVVDPQTVLSGAKEAAAVPRVASIPAKERLLASLVDAPQAQVAPQSTVAAPDVVRGLALAALAIMGRTGDANEPSFEALLHDATSADCLKMAKLNLNQCLAVAGPNYEDVYCTGRHAVGETATCVSAAANGSGAALPPVAPLPVQQRVEGYGPEQAQAYGQPGLQPQDKDDDDRQAPQPPRYASAQPTPQPGYDAAQAYAPPAAAPARPAPPAYADSRTYAQNDQAYAQPAAPYQAPPAYAAQPQQPQQPQYAQQPYSQQQPQYQQPQYPQPTQAYAAPQQQPVQRGYQATTPTTQYPYGYAARGYYGQ